MTHLSLDYNCIEKEGVQFLAKQLGFGQGGDWTDPSDVESVFKSRLTKQTLPWRITHLSLRDNDITDFAIDDICACMNKLLVLEKLYVDGNLFYRTKKFDDCLAFYKKYSDREVIPVVNYELAEVIVPERILKLKDAMDLIAEQLAEQRPF